ncbi:hypothetical protein GCM10007067_13430 [Lysobacter bugurensis]|uniref:Uncharacterized protein n=1 Tax=Cognatilysobacter bugurensis TaxID=543356 RepID=A0A918SXY6_9GAMM|nr:hypothetical protein GCM10007067_13430 [Lysobacter bugurensis]
MQPALADRIDERLQVAAATGGEHGEAERRVGVGHGESGGASRVLQLIRATIRSGPAALLTRP